MGSMEARYPETELLVEETAKGRDPTYDVILAKEERTWTTLHAELGSLVVVVSRVSLGKAEEDRVETILRFCQICFAHGSSIQALAVSCGMHESISQSIPFLPRLAYNALSNLVTRNGETVETVLVAYARIEGGIVRSTETEEPVSSLLFFRNALAHTSHPRHPVHW